MLGSRRIEPTTTMNDEKKSEVLLKHGAGPSRTNGSITLEMTWPAPVKEI